jgi:5-methylcytosine-specific restriction endonuclease McrA
VSSAVVYHSQLSHLEYQRWLSVKSHVLGQMGIKEGQVATADNFIALANTLYDLSIQPGNFAHAIDRFFVAINGLSKTARRKLRKKNVGKIGYECRPHGAVIKAERIAAAKAKKAHSPSPKKLASVKSYQDKHLVLITKDGQKVFNNVKQHSSQQDREDFYRSWDWRTLRMKVIKKYGRRCMCCGSTPSDVDTSGAPVRIVVDHIKPLANFWQMRLVPSNLQILCDECNMGKGAWDETDHRSDVEKLIAEQLRYEI